MEYTKTQKCTETEKLLFDFEISQKQMVVKFLSEQIQLYRDKAEQLMKEIDAIDRKIYDYESIEFDAVYYIQRENGFALIYKDGIRCEEYVMMPSGKAQLICDRLNLEIHNAKDKTEIKTEVDKEL